MFWYSINLIDALSVVVGSACFFALRFFSEHSVFAPVVLVEILVEFVHLYYRAK